MNMSGLKSCIYIVICYWSHFLIVDANIDTDFGALFENADALDNVVESLTDYLDGSECTFQCPYGEKRVPRAGFKPSHNGCGSYGFKIESDNLPEMTKCCNTHDLCYGTCNENRDACDREFKKCLEKMCVKRKKHVPDCEATADLMYKGAVTLGCRAFKKGQKNACVCIPEHAKKQTSKNKSQKKGEL